jgi:GABA(A) receptor-associated protein
MQQQINYPFIHEFQKKSFAYRKSESSKILLKYPDQIPVVVDVFRESSIKINKNKYLVPSDLTVAQFIYMIRKRCTLPREKTLFLFINNCLPPSLHIMSQIYKDNANEDGFLYINIHEETTFG